MTTKQIIITALIIGTVVGIALGVALTPWFEAKDARQHALADCIASQAEADGIAFHPHVPEAWEYYEQWCIEQMNNQ